MFIQTTSLAPPVSKSQSGGVLFYSLFLNVRRHILKAFPNRVLTKRRINIYLVTGSGSAVFFSHYSKKTNSKVEQKSIFFFVHGHYTTVEHPTSNGMW